MSDTEKDGEAAKAKAIAKLAPAPVPVGKLPPAGKTLPGGPPVKVPQDVAGGAGGNLSGSHSEFGEGATQQQQQQQQQAPHRPNSHGAPQWGGAQQSVPPVSGRSGWMQFAFLFEHFAVVNLSEVRYQQAGLTEYDRASAYINALTRAAMQGGFNEMVSDVMVLSKAGYQCEALLAQLEKRYAKSNVLQKQKALEKLLSLRRVTNSTLLSAVTAYKGALMECVIVGYTPDKETKGMTLRRVVTVAELQAAEARAWSQGVDVADPEQLCEILYEMGVTYEAMQGETQGGVFAGAATQSSGRRQGKKKVVWRPDMEGCGKEVAEGDRKEVIECEQCGLQHYEDHCPAYGKVCHECGAKGHFRARCPNKKKSDSKANVCVSEDVAFFGSRF